MPSPRPHAPLARALSRLLVPLVAGLLACGGDSGTEPHTGALVVPRIEGLPAGAAPQVTVTGPGGFSRVIAAAELPDTLAALPPGAYVVTASEVTVGTVRWSPTPATQTLNVGDGYRVEAAPITYVNTSTRLDVTVMGLPAGTPADVRVTGAGGVDVRVTESGAVESLRPGEYVVTGLAVQANGRTYRAAPQAVTLTGGASSAVLVDYGAGSASLRVAVTGVPAGTAAAVTVSGPGGYARTLTGSRELAYLEPGTYTVTAAPFTGSLASYAPATASQSFTIADNGTATADVAYSATPLDLGRELVVEGLANPAFLTAPAGDARLFVVERAGRVRVVKDGVLLATPFLDIATRVWSAGERGMLGLAFDPQYATTGRFYVYYVDFSGSVVVERFESTPGSDVAGASRGIVISIPHGGTEHHGGTIAFGPDDMLYVAPGDGRCCGDPDNHAQDANVLLGKVLRLDVRNATTYTIPAGNPFVGVANARPEIWALGLRNPWRFSFDVPAGASTGTLYIGDVGQDAREEVNAVPSTAAGRNYGWPLTEGTACYKPATGCSRTGQTMPVEEYTHADGCSVTGGYVYRGTRIPELAGHYLYADYCRGWVRSFRLTSAGAATERRDWPGVTTGQLLSFGRDGLGELYVISGSGRVWRIVRR